MRFNKKLAKYFIYELSQEYCVRIFYSKNITYSGHCHYWNRTVTIGLNQSAEDMIATFFHELGHIHCYERGIWKSFHTSKYAHEMTDIEKNKLLRTVVKAEKWVDKWGKKEMSKHFTNIKYRKAYNTPELITELKEYWSKYVYGR